MQNKLLIIPIMISSCVFGLMPSIHPDYLFDNYAKKRGKNIKKNQNFLQRYLNYGYEAAYSKEKPMYKTFVYSLQCFRISKIANIFLLIFGIISLFNFIKIERFIDIFIFKIFLDIAGI